ncbi:Ubiquitin carboxyl-terminal hydrolase 42, partial [Conglomerata obtusa]
MKNQSTNIILCIFASCCIASKEPNQSNGRKNQCYVKMQGISDKDRMSARQFRQYLDELNAAKEYELRESFKKLNTHDNESQSDYVSQGATANAACNFETNLINQNNSCYADSVLRCLYNQRDFVSFIYEVTGFFVLCDKKNLLIGRLNNLFEIIDSKADSTHTFDVIWKYFEKQTNPTLEFGRPQDVQDFLQYIIQGIEAEILQSFPDFNEYYINRFRQLFVGQINYYYGNKKNPLSFQYIFHDNYYLPFNTVENTINQTMEKCNDLKGIEKSKSDNYQIKQLPERIIIPISRNYGEAMVDPPLNICEEFDFLNIPEFWNCPIAIRETKYDLDAFIVKSYEDSSQGEHYYCYCKINGIWYLFDGLKPNSNIIDNAEIKKLLRDNAK